MRHLRRRVCLHTQRQPGHRDARHREYDCGQLAAQQRVAEAERHADYRRIQTAHLAQLRLPARRKLGRPDGSQLPPHRPDAVPRFPEPAPATESGGRRRHGTQRRDHQERKSERTRRHLLQSGRRTLRNESVAGGHRDKQAQLHPFPRCCRPLAGGRTAAAPRLHCQQGKHGVHTAAHGRQPVTSALHPLFLQHQPHQDTVVAYYRT